MYDSNIKQFYEPRKFRLFDILDKRECKRDTIDGRNQYRLQVQLQIVRKWVKYNLIYLFKIIKSLPDMPGN